MKKARDIMRREMITIGPETTVGESIEIILKHGISGLPIIDNSGDLIGMITEFALLASAYDRAVQHEPVERHMTRQIVSVDVDASLHEIADRFIVNRIRRVPVLDNGKLVGLISRRDVLRGVHQSQQLAASTS